MDIAQNDDQAVAIPFDEAWYLYKYPEIANAVRNGTLKSGLEHYLVHGRAEGRQPLSPTDAARYWETVQRRSPHDPTAYLALAKALREGGRLDEAEAVLHAAIERFPGDPRPLVDWAQVAVTRQDWPEAIRRWETARRAFPGEISGYTAAAASLREAGRGTEAESLLVEAMQRFPDSADPLIEHAWLAHARQDWNAAVLRWEKVRACALDWTAGYINAVHALSELGRRHAVEALVNEAAARLGGDPTLALQMAWDATRRHAWQQADWLWTALLDIAPDRSDCYLGGALALRELGRPEEAEALIARGQLEFPDHPGIGLSWGDLAMHRHDWTEAARRWLILRRCFPAELRCGIDAVRALTFAGRHGQAEAMAADLRTRHPDNFQVAFHWADAADWRSDWKAAAARWAELRDQFPAEASPYVHGIRALFESGEPAGALELARLAVGRFPTNQEIIWTAGNIAARSGDFDTAAEHFKAAYAKNRDNLSIAVGYVENLLRLDRRAEAAMILRQAMDQWPGNEQLFRMGIEVALRDRDFEGALLIWRQLRATHAEARDFPSEMAMKIITASPSDAVLEALLDFLSEEADTGEQSWVPAFANLRDHFIRYDLAMRTPIQAWLDRTEHRMNAGCHLLWKALIASPFTESEIEYAFEQYLAKSRMALVATLFIDSSFAIDWSCAARTFAVFERFIARKLTAAEWIREDNPHELLSYLMFATVASFDAYRRLVRAGVERLAFNGVPDNASPETAETALAGVLRAASSIDLAPDIPAVVSRPSRVLHVALCVSGQLRGFERALPTWSQLGLQDHATTTFVHTWEDTGRHWTRTWWFLRDYPALWQAVTADNGVAFLQKRFPSLGEAVAAAIAGGMDITADRLKTFYQTDHVVVENGLTDAWKRRENVWKLHYKIEQAHALAQAKMPKDTLYIKIRPDQNIAGCDPIDWERVYFESKRDRMLYADMPFMFIGNAGILKMADAFLVGAPEPMTAFAGVYSAQLALMARGSTFFEAPRSLNAHTSVAYSTFYQGVVAKRLFEVKTDGFLEALILPPTRILELLVRDVGNDPDAQLERDFLEACRKVAG